MRKSLIQYNIIAFSLLSALTLGAPAFAADAPVTDAKKSEATAKPKTYDPDRIVCRAVEQTGSRLGTTRVCRTVAEWDQISKDSRTASDDVQRHSKQQPVPGS